MSALFGIRDIFDDISLSVASFLEDHPQVSGIKFTDRPAAKEADVVAWEKRNSPFKLPKDFKSFLLISDGLLLRWNIQHVDEEIALGCLQVNRLKDVKRIVPSTVPDDDDEEEAEADGEGEQQQREQGKEPGRRGRDADKPRALAMFDLDLSCKWGKVVSRVACFAANLSRYVCPPHAHFPPHAPPPQAFYYCRGTRDPQIWFQDMACEWFFVADSFTDYFRLMIMHLGLPSWHYTFTDIGFVFYGL